MANRQNKKARRLSMQLEKKVLPKLQIEADIPTLVFLFPSLIAYSKFKNECITKYNNLIRRESNIEHFYLDPGMGISISINSVKKTYSLMVNNIIISDGFLLFDGSQFEEIIKIIKNVQGIYIHAAHISNNTLESEEFVISVFKVTVDGICVLEVDKKINDKNFLNLPDLDWYKDGIINPGGGGVGTILDEEKNLVYAVIRLSEYTSRGYESLVEIFRENLIIRDGYVKNLSIIIDETDRENILLKVEIFNLKNSKHLFNATYPIQTTKHYVNFKEYFNNDQFCYLELQKVTQGEELIETFNDVKLKNIIIINDKRRGDFVNWINPVNLDLGGLDGNKKILINEKTLEVGIYKHVELRNLTDDYVRKIVNELVANKIGLELKLPMVDTSFHMDQYTVGIITKLVPPPVYKLDEIEMENICNFSCLIDMVAFDILVCNTDRHVDNICFSKKNNNYYPVLIDHTRCLGGYLAGDLRKLHLDNFPVFFNFTGLQVIGDRISEIKQFYEIISKIESLKFDEIFEFIFEEELQKFIESCNVYDEKIGIINILSDTFKKRQKNIKNIIKKSLDL
ncbi:hypothetical protein ACYCS5_04195 [Paenibacillus sp. SEL3]